MNKIDSSFQAYLQSELPDLQQDQTFERLKLNENKAGLYFSEMPFSNDPDSKSQQWNNYIEALTQVATPKEDELISLLMQPDWCLKWTLAYSMSIFPQLIVRPYNLWVHLFINTKIFQITAYSFQVKICSCKIQTPSFIPIVTVSIQQNI